MIHIKASRENIFLHNFERDDENKIMFWVVNDVIHADLATTPLINILTNYMTLQQWKFSTRPLSFALINVL
jgi:hypothetical protein